MNVVRLGIGRKFAQIAQQSGKSQALQFLIDWHKGFGGLGNSNLEKFRRRYLPQLSAGRKVEGPF